MVRQKIMQEAGGGGTSAPALPVTPVAPMSHRIPPPHSPSYEKQNLLFNGALPANRHVRAQGNKSIEELDLETSTRKHGTNSRPTCFWGTRTRATRAAATSGETLREPWAL